MEPLEFMYLDVNVHIQFLINLFIYKILTAV